MSYGTEPFCAFGKNINMLLLMNCMRKRVVLFIHKWLGRKVTQAHIMSEMKRHYMIAKTSVKYLIIMCIFVGLYLLTEGKFLFDTLAVGLIVFFISSFIPDIAYLLWKFITGDKSYIPSQKRKYSHRTVGLVAYSVIVMALFSFITSLNRSIIITAFAFLGYWVHIATDKVELIIDRLKLFLQKSIRE